MTPVVSNTARRRHVGRAAAPLLRILRAVFRATERSRQRRALARLSDAHLSDIGLTRHDVDRECAKPGWRR
jgi:uncharacterized protein YjiS (DUF1127 family)